MNSISISYLYSLSPRFMKKANIFNYFSTMKNLASIYQISNEYKILLKINF